MWIAATTAGLFAGAGLIIAIGAQNAFVLRQGLQRRHVGTVVLACAGADIALILAGVGGMGALVQQWPLLLQVLRFGGAAFLLWYGLQAGLRAWHGGSACGCTPAARSSLATMSWKLSVGFISHSMPTRIQKLAWALIERLETVQARRSWSCRVSSMLTMPIGGPD